MKMILSLLVLFSASILLGQNIELAKSYHTHKLIQKAKEEFILVLHTSKTPDSKAETLYWLGNISFEESSYSTAFEDWKKLVSDYPTSKYAIEIKGRLEQLKDVMQQVSEENITSSIARSYLRNSDFWSKAESKILIDGSWLPSVELAVDWYDRVIKEFPGTNAAEEAYKQKLFTLFGWEKTRQSGEDYGLKKDFEKYMPQILQTFQEYETNFPESYMLQGFRYQIAQGYWQEKDWNKTKEWLQKVIDSSKGLTTFYSETAKARLKKVEY
ncbi:MAG: outer membrane protein assembly factor BamD [Ignavibacteriales bacterium]|nr:outer membrane protein assembly factor BamD [Ignavibacteriales bacterium]